jgi:hypothetical protein
LNIFGLLKLSYQGLRSTIRQGKKAERMGGGGKRERERLWFENWVWVSESLIGRLKTMNMKRKVGQKAEV